MATFEKVNGDYQSQLNDWINQLNKEGKSYLRLESILKQILFLSKNHIANILSENPEWKCLIGEQYLQKIVVFYSYNEFLNFKIKSILFKNPDTNSIQDALIASLVKASNEIQPILVDKEIANLIREILSLSHFVNFNMLLGEASFRQKYFILASLLN